MRRSGRVALVLPSLILGVVVAGCGQSQRTAASYCHVFATDGAAFRSEYLGQDVQKHPLQGLVSIVTAPQQLATFFAKLDAVAPPDIEPDVKALQDSYQKLSDNTATSITNPLGGLVGDLANGLTSMPSYSAVDSYTKQHCGALPQ